MLQSQNFIKLVVLIALVISSSCQKRNDIEINADVKGLDAKVAYLKDGLDFKAKPLDSANITNGRFSFKLHPDTLFQPRLVMIGFDNRKINAGVINPFEHQDGKDHAYGQFVMETGVTNLTGDLTKKRDLNIDAGPQNEFYFKEQTLPYIIISQNPTKHKAQVERFIDKVSNLPNAYWAMYALNNLKFQLTRTELNQMLNAFDEPTKQSYLGKQIKSFIDNKLNENDLRPNHLLTDDKGNKANLIDTTKKLNMVIFWASWCGPCNLEIPSMKKIAAKYTDKNFRMVSVTIDKDKDQWKQRLAVVKMPWQQLSIDNTDLAKLTSQYNLGSIPQIFFINGHRKLVKYVSGYDPANEAIFDKTISEALKTN